MNENEMTLAEFIRYCQGIAKNLDCGEYTIQFSTGKKPVISINPNSKKAVIHSID